MQESRLRARGVAVAVPVDRRGQELLLVAWVPAAAGQRVRVALHADTHQMLEYETISTLTNSLTVHYTNNITVHYTTNNLTVQYTTLIM